MDREPQLTAATIIHHVVSDLLFQNDFEHADLTELVDLAVICTGLGIIQSNFTFVQKGGLFWDSTFWTSMPRPFLDTNNLAYVSAVAAWVRGEKDPKWSEALPNEVKRPLRKSLKFLLKTNDSFIDPSTNAKRLTERSQQEWLQMAREPSVSKQVIAIRQLAHDDQLEEQQTTLLLEKIRSNSRTVVLHTIRAIESLRLVNEPIIDELRFLVEQRDDEIRAKAMIAVARLRQLDDATIASAKNMVDASAKAVVLAGVLALASIENASDDIQKVMERGFIRSLQTCDYEFVNLYTSAFNRWLDDPESRFRQLLTIDHPEYVDIAIESLQTVREQLAEGVAVEQTVE